MRSFPAASALLLGALSLSLFAASPARAELLVTVSKTQQRASVVIDGTEAFRWPVSTGKRGHDTPAGKYRPQRLERRWYSSQYESSPMPWAVFFHRGYALHGTMEAYNLGRAASHGCVRLRPDNASVLYSLVRRYGMDNTRVVVMSGPLPTVTPPAAPAIPLPAPRIEVKLSDADPLAPATVADIKASVGIATFSARQHAADVENESGMEAEAVQAHETPTVRVRVLANAAYGLGTSEKRVMRDREDWLRSLDRKYGIVR